jgi:hypothetical protein
MESGSIPQGPGGALSLVLNHELHETHELAGVGAVVARPNVTPQVQGLFAEVREQGDGQPASLQVVDNLRRFHVSNIRLGFELNEDTAFADEIGSVQGGQGPSQETNWNGCLSQVGQPSILEGQLDSLLVGLLQVSWSHVRVDLEQCTDDGMGQWRFCGVEHAITHQQVALEHARTTVGFVRFVQFVVSGVA